MVLSLLAKLRNKYFQEFIRIWGREPQSAKEWMSIQDDAVRELNKTKGVPTEAKPPWHTGWTPKVVPGGKGIEGLLKSGDVTVGTAPKTTKETLKAKKDRHLLLRDSEEDIARIKRENKEAIDRFRRKFMKKDDFAAGGIARAGFGKGKLAKGFVEGFVEFIDGLFIKSSNDIRLGKGLFKGLGDKEKWVQHDNLTKMVTQWQKTKKLPEGAEQYFGVDPYIAFGKSRGIKIVKNPKTDATEGITYTKTETTPNTQDPNLPPSITTTEGSGEMLFRTSPKVTTYKGPRPDLEEAAARTGKVFNPKTDRYVTPKLVSDDVLAKAYDEVFYQKPASGDYKYDADVLSDSIAEQLGKESLDDFSQVQQTEIYDTALKRVQQDLQINRAKKIAEKNLIDLEQKVELEMFDPKDRKPNASGGRADFIFGGSAGLRALLKRLRGTNKRVFPSPPQGIRNLMSQADTDYIDDLKLQQLETILRAAKIDKETLAHSFKVKKMNDPNLDFLMGKLEESGMKAKNIDKYTDIDKDIMNIEMMIKNFTEKKLKRKPHQSGGLAYMLGEPTYMKYGAGGDVGHAPWLKPTGQQQPQPPQQQPGPAPQGGGQAPGGGRPNPMKAPRGLPSLAPRTMDPAVMQQQAMQKMMMGQGQPRQQRMGMEEGGSPRDRLQKDYESLTKGADWMRTAPPKWWLFPEYDPTGHRDDAMTWFKERFMYGDLDAIPTPWEAFKQSPELVKFKEWLEERKGKAEGGRIGLATGEQVYGPPLPEEKIKSPTGEYKTREEIIAEAGIGSGPGVLDFVRPRVDITQTGGPPEKTPSVPVTVDERDITYGGSGLYQGDKAYVGGDYLTGNVKVKVQDEDGNIVFDDTMSKDEFYNLYVGLGKKEGNKVEIGKDTHGTWTLNIAKESNEGDKWDFGVRKAEESEPYVTIKKKWKKKPKILGKYNANQGGRIGMMYGGDPGFQFEYGGSWADWRDQHQHQMPVTDYIKTKLPKERLPFRDMQSGGIARLPLGLGSMSRRAFLKMMAAVGTLPFIGKGISKVAPKVIPQVTETIVRDSAGIPTYAFDLIEVVKAKGVQEIIEGVTKKVPAKKYSYKGVEVTVHPDGLTEVRKVHEGPASWSDEAGETFSDEAIHREVGFDIKEGEIVTSKKGKPLKTDDEYFEATVRPDDEGKLKDIEEFMEEVDHLDLKKIADEKETLIIKKSKKIKKASGGLAHMLGE